MTIVHMALKRIIISEVQLHQFIELLEVEGQRKFTIIIGLFEAEAMNRRVKKQAAPRPLTHDLILRVIEELDGELHDVIISELKDSTYYAKIRIRYQGELREIDCRPSDAIVIAVAADLPIYVSEEVLREACNEM